MSKTFAWILFLSSVLCFLVQFTTQQLAAAADDLRADVLQGVPTTQAWQFADLSDAGDDY